MDEPVGQFLHLPFLYRKDEVVLVVMSQRERAVVLTEEGLVADALGLLRDVDIAVAHALHLAVGQEGFHLDALGAYEIEDFKSVVGHAQAHLAFHRRTTCRVSDSHPVEKKNIRKVIHK